MNIDELTIGQLKEIKSMTNQSSSDNTSVKVGDKVLIRTVTMMYTGKVEAITASDFVLSSAAWIADSGRYGTALKDGFGSSAEIEPYPDRVTVFRGGIIDVAEWKHELPRDQQ